MSSRWDDFLESGISTYSNQGCMSTSVDGCCLGSEQRWAAKYNVALQEGARRKRETRVAQSPIHLACMNNWKRNWGGKMWMISKSAWGVYPFIFQEIGHVVSSQAIEERYVLQEGTIPTGLKVSITMRHLAAGDNYHSLMYSFMIARNTIPKVVSEVRVAILLSMQGKPSIFPLMKMGGVM